MKIFSKAEAKQEIRDLIKKFERLIPVQRKKYNEANTCKDFVLPLFHALNWDVYNDQLSNEVIAEEKTVAGRIDYSFRLHNLTQFLLEAKAIHVDLEKEQWAKQAIEYGWNKGISWVVLTNFEGLKVFNSDWKKSQPQANLTFTYKDYLTNFDDFWLLSRESIKKGEFNVQAQKWGITAKRVNVNEVLAKDLVEWREILVNNLRKWNKQASQHDLGEAVQRILDRLIFIRVVEDRDIEEKTLWQAYQKWQAKGYQPANFIKSLAPIFRKYDKEYNSNLFAEHLCEKLETEGDPFTKIIPRLYGEKEAGIKYNFNAINADVLGGVYEQYLGKVQESEGSVSKRKKQGIYYTPNYIVEYIVQNTLGRLLKETSSLADREKIKILDPACGSGSFLLKAFELMDENLRKERTDPALRKSRILTENIYGVDLDKQAIEIARLNLLLKALIPDQKLPMLTEHMKVGNSLIDDQKIDKKAFNWPEEFKNAFSQKNPGFDVIIENPPYIDSESMVVNMKKSREFISKNYSTAKGNWDIFCVFIERALQLLKVGGYLGVIVPNKLISAGYAKSIRNLLEQFSILSIVDYSKIQVFSANVYPIVLIVRKSKPLNKQLIELRSFSGQKPLINKMLQSDFKKFNRAWVLNFIEDLNLNFLNKLKISNPGQVLSSATVSEAYEVKKIISDGKNGDSFKFINTGSIDPYRPLWGIKKTQYLGDSYLRPFINKQSIKNLYPKRYLTALKPKIVIAGMTKQIEALYDERAEFFSGKSTSIIIPSSFNPKYLLAILNSKLVSFVYRKMFKHLTMQGGFMNIGPKQLSFLPIVVPKKEQEKEIIESVDLLQKQISKLNSTETETDNYNSAKYQIEKIRLDIDNNIFKLYGLTPEEIKIVESNSN